jgi:hypothetical protein
MTLGRPLPTLAQVGSAGERPARTGQQHRPDAVIGRDGLHSLEQVNPELGVQRVHGVGPVQFELHGRA